jgi:hypothetical protein
MNTIITSVAVPLLVALVGFLVAYLDKLKEQAKAKINDARFNKYVDIAEDAIETAVLSVTQTIVDNVKGTDAWTEEKQKRVFEAAKLQAITIMGASAKTALKEVYGDFDAWINAKIEAYVKQNKAA